MTEPTQDMMLSDLRTPLGAAPGRRVGDAERAACCETLSDHFAAGRLRADELELRLDAAVRAVTEVDLRRLVADLPAARPSTSPSTSPPPAVAGTGWSAVTAVAVVVFAVCALVAGGLLLVLGAVNPLLFVGACLGGGAAFAGGVSGTVLLQQGRRRLDPTGPPRPTR